MNLCSGLRLASRSSPCLGPLAELFSQCKLPGILLCVQTTFQKILLQNKFPSPAKPLSFGLGNIPWRPSRARDNETTALASILNGFPTRWSAQPYLIRTSHRHALMQCGIPLSDLRRKLRLLIGTLPRRWRVFFEILLLVSLECFHGRRNPTQRLLVQRPQVVAQTNRISITSFPPSRGRPRSLSAASILRYRCNGTRKNC